MKSRNFALSSAITQYSISIIPTLGSGGPQSGPVKHICLSLCLCVSVSVGSSASLFGEHLRGPYFSAAHAAAGHRFRSIISTVVLYPHTGVRRTPVGSSWAYMSVSLSGRPRRFLEIICVARNCAQRMRPQATSSNPLSDSIICPSVRPVVRGPFAVFVFVFISSVGVQRRGAFIVLIVLSHFDLRLHTSCTLITNVV